MNEQNQHERLYLYLFVYLIFSFLVSRVVSVGSFFDRFYSFARTHVSKFIEIDSNEIERFVD